MDFLSGHGASVMWGTHTLTLTSLSVSASPSSEIDITSMSSEVVSDPYESSHKLVVQDYDTFASAKYGTEFSVEFYAGTAFASSHSLSMVGSRRNLSLKFNVSTGAASYQTYIDNRTALMTQMQITGSVGEYVRGSATFKLSGR